MIPLEEHPNLDENINFREETQETYQNRTAFDKEGVKTISLLIMTFIHYHQYWRNNSEAFFVQFGPSARN